MSICVTLLCPECGQLFDDSLRRTCVGTCHHLICLSCKNSLTPPNCPLCDKPDAFKETTYNHQTINVLADFQKCLSEADIEKFTADLQNLGCGPCSKCNELTPKLRVCTNCTSFITPNGSGGWRPSYWLEGRNASLKTKSLAICSDCAAEYHEGHKTISLTSIDSITAAFEIDILLSMRFLVERNWKRDVEEGRTTVVAVLPKSIALQWKLEARNMIIRDESLCASANLLKYPSFFSYTAEIKASLAKIKKWRMRMANYRMMNIMTHKKRIEIMADRLSLIARTPEQRRNVVEVRENLKLLPTGYLTPLEYEFYDREVTRRLIECTVEMAERYPDRRTDKEFLRFQVMKEELIRAKEAFKAADQEIYESVHNLSIHMEKCLPERLQIYRLDFITFMNNFQYNDELKRLRMKVDKAHIAKFKAIVDDQFVAAIGLKSSFSDPSYWKEIEKLALEHENVALDFDLASMKI